jgi:large subunit ribosomal protein L3
MKFTLGTKLHMTHVFGEDGLARAATVLAVPEATVTQVKNSKKDGYTAVQLGTGTQKDSRINKAGRGHLKDLPSVAHLQEFRIEGDVTMARGDKVSLSQFKAGDVLTVTAVSKGKGFQGVVKRHGFGGGPRTHGQKHSEREPGSIGGGLRNKVPKKMRMAGRMGGDTVTIKNLKVLHVNEAENLLFIEGAVPGRRGTMVAIKAA